MTARDKLHQILRKSMIFWFGAVAVFAGSMFIFVSYGDSNLPAFLPILGMGILIAVFFKFVWLPFACPWCSANISFLVFHSRIRDPFSIPRRVKFCPCCGADPDKPLKSMGEA